MATNELTTFTNLKEAMEFCQRLSETQFVPESYKKKPGEILAAIQYGSEVGLGPMQSLQSIAVINGRPSLWGDSLLGLVQKSGLLEYIKESVTATEATCELKRKDDKHAHVEKFSMDDARKAGLAGKQGPWQQYPKRMMQMRARTFALRNKFADVLKGLISREEAMDYPSVETTATEVPDNPPPGEMKVSETLTLVVEGQGQPRKATTQGNGSTPPAADPAVDPLITDQQQIRLLAAAKRQGWTMQQIGQSLNDAFGIPDLSELRASQVSEFEAMIQS